MSLRVPAKRRRSKRDAAKADFMSLRAAIGIISQLQQQNVIRRYAIAGAVAALNYIQPTLTEDLDILISVGDFGTRKSGLLLLTPIEQVLAKLGFTEIG